MKWSNCIFKGLPDDNVRKTILIDVARMFCGGCVYWRQVAPQKCPFGSILGKIIPSFKKILKIFFDVPAV
jgi:hypothetical protein